MMAPQQCPGLGGRGSVWTSPQRTASAGVVTTHRAGAAVGAARSRCPRDAPAASHPQPVVTQPGDSRSAHADSALTPDSSSRR